MGFQFLMLRSTQFVRRFYRDAPSLNSDNRNVTAAKNVTRFAMAVIVADMFITTLRCLSSCSHNRRHPRSEPQRRADSCEEIQRGGLRTRSALLERRVRGPLLAGVRPLTGGPRKSLQINDVRNGGSRHP